MTDTPQLQRPARTTGRKGPVFYDRRSRRLTARGNVAAGVAAALALLEVAMFAGSGGAFTAVHGYVLMLIVAFSLATVGCHLAIHVIEGPYRRAVDDDQADPDDPAMAQRTVTVTRHLSPVTVTNRTPLDSRSDGVEASPQAG